MRARTLTAREASSGRGFRAVVDAIRRGDLLAYPAETMYGLGGDGLDGEVVARVALAKGSRPGRPFLLLLDEPDRWGDVASSFPEEAAALASRHWPGPLTLLLPARPGSPSASGGKIAVRVPDLPLVRAWVSRSGRPLLSTSANRAGEEPIREPLAVEERFGESVDLIVVGPVFPRGGPPSTVVDCTASPPRLVRAGAIPFPS